MSPRKAKPLTEDEAKKLWPLFGPLPVLSSEDKDAYDEIRKGYVAFYRPSNMFHLKQVRELVDADWEIFRFVRHRTATIEWHFQIRMNNWRDRVDSNNDGRRHKLGDLLKYRDPEDKEVLDLKSRIAKAETLMLEIAQRKPDEADHNRALEEAADFLDKLNRWLDTARVRRNSLLKILEYYCAPTDQEDENPAAEYDEIKQEAVKQIAAPPVVPPESVANDVATQNSNEPIELAKE